MMWTVLVLALVAHCASAEFSVTKVCQPGATWNDGCNNCRCTETGVTLCTQRACLSSPTLDGQGTGQDAGQGTAECTEGAVWQEDCNTCRCAGGRKACTYKKCITPPPQDQQAPGTCTPGTTWKQDCNTCRCTPNGRAACTLMACLNLGAIGGGPLEVANECTPGTTWRKDCNGCRCTSTGRAICTQKACLTKRSVKPERVGDECEPGTTWQKDCNTCRCSPSGVAACTLKLCVPRQQRDVVAAMVANAEPAAPAAEVEPRRCVQGETWKQACNTCRCTPAGLPACTKMRCVTKPKEEAIPSSTATETETNENAAATETPPAFLCRPGSTWKKACNTCKCALFVPVCTLMACSED